DAAFRLPDAMHVAELAWAFARSTPREQETAVGRVLVDPRVSIAVGHVEVAAWRTRNIGREVEGASRAQHRSVLIRVPRVGRLVALAKLHELLAVGAELHDDVGPTIHQEDVSVSVEAHSVPIAK